MVSSLANAIKRKTHKERSQPASRRKYGLLEKRKDYIQRARDFHKKERTIKILKRKAEEKNSDEFYFAMEKARTKGGVQIGTGGEANKYSAEELALMRSQDVNYLGMKRQVEMEKIEGLQEALHYIGMPGRNKHQVFVESRAEAEQFNPEAYFDTPKELLDRRFNRPKKDTIKDPQAVSLVAGPKAKKAIARAERRRQAAYEELEQRLRRKELLERTMGKLVRDKELAGKGRKRKLGKTELAPKSKGQTSAPVYKWKRERKK